MKCLSTDEFTELIFQFQLKDKTSNFNRNSTVVQEKEVSGYLVKKYINETISILNVEVNIW